MTKVSEVLRQILAERNITPEELVEAVVRQDRKYAPADFSREEVEKIVDGTAVTRRRIFYFVVYVDRALGLDEAEVGRLRAAALGSLRGYGAVLPRTGSLRTDCLRRAGRKIGPGSLQ